MSPEFWRIIDQTRPAVFDPQQHAHAITAHLVATGIDATLRFAEEFDRAFDALFTWELWGVAYLAMGGLSDDAFEYVRAWVIGAGQVSWTLAWSDPESLFVDLLEGSPDPEARWESIRLHHGESLLHAAGSAHEQLTGRWLGSRSQPYPEEPAGVEWIEDDLPHTFPNLTAALPDGWWDLPILEPTPALQVFLDVERGVEAFLNGDHSTAVATLEPILTDPQRWRLVLEERRMDVAYAVGIGRLSSGNVEGAAEALHLVESQMAEHGDVRRALAQVELARGNLDEADRWIDQSPDAAQLDRVLNIKLDWRRGQHENATRRATDELHAPIHDDRHPWDIAGCLLQIAQILIEAGDADGAQLAADAMDPLLEDAPDQLPLLTHFRLLQAGVTRLQGQPLEALRILETLLKDLDGTDLAECLREVGRSQHALELPKQATASYEEAIATFQRAGERWEAEATRAEAGL